MYGYYTYILLYVYYYTYIWLYVYYQSQFLPYTTLNKPLHLVYRAEEGIVLLGLLAIWNNY